MRRRKAVGQMLSSAKLHLRGEPDENKFTFALYSSQEDEPKKRRELGEGER